MGNTFVTPRYMLSRTYQNFIPKKDCDIITVDKMVIENLKTVRICLRNLKINYLHKNQIMRCLKHAINKHPDIRYIGYILCRTRRGVILKIVNKEVHPIYDELGQKWFYLDYQLEPAHSYSDSDSDSIWKTVDRR